jgi:hypothetical protein
MTARGVLSATGAPPARRRPAHWRSPRHPDADQHDREERDRQLATALLEAATVPLAIHEAAADFTTLAAHVAHRRAPRQRSTTRRRPSGRQPPGATQAAATLVLVNPAVSGNDPSAARAPAAGTTAAHWHQTTHEDA